MTDPREVIPAGEQDWPGYRHLIPIARLIPANIWFDDSIGLIRDQDNGVSFTGYERIMFNHHGDTETAEEHGARLRREGLGRGPG